MKLLGEKIGKKYFVRLLGLDGTHLTVQKCNSEVTKFLLKGVVDGKAGTEDRKATNVLSVVRTLKIPVNLSSMSCSTSRYILNRKEN